VLVKGYWFYVSWCVITIILLYIYYTILFFHSHSCDLSSLFPHSFNTCRCLLFDTYISSMFMFQTHPTNFWPRMFYRSGWLRCVVFKLCVSVQHLKFEHVTLGVILLYIYYYTYTYILYYTLLSLSSVLSFHSLFLLYVSVFIVRYLYLIFLPILSNHPFPVFPSSLPSPPQMLDSFIIIPIQPSIYILLFLCPFDVVLGWKCVRRLMSYV
jgi:hypothetical protein